MLTVVYITYNIPLARCHFGPAPVFGTRVEAPGNQTHPAIPIGH